MSRFIFYTDLHFAGKRPRCRIDDFSVTIIEKLRQIYDLAIEEDVDAVLFGGDMFNSHRVYRYDMLIEMISIINGSGTTTFATIGQHDLRGYNPSSYGMSTLGLMDHFCPGFTTLWQPVELDDVYIHPCHVFDEFDAQSTVSVPPDKHSILIAHKLLSKKKEIFPVILTKDVRTEFDLVLSGDLHSGVPVHTLDGTTFYNPGAVTRLSVADIKRTPKVGIIESGDEMTIREHLLDTQPGCDVFDRSIVEEMKNRKSVDTSEFVQGIMDMELESVDVYDLIQKAASMQDLRREVLDYLLDKRKE